MDKQITQMRPDLAYLRSEVETADPLKLLIMLYNRLIRELTEIRDMLDRADPAAPEADAVELGEKFEKSRNILSHLMESLNPAAGEVSERLTSMYYYFYQKILTVQVEKDGRIIDEILPNLETLREGWLGIQDGASDT